MIRFVLLVNKQGQTRIARYNRYVPVSTRLSLEGEIVRKCLSRKEDQCSVLDYMNQKVVFKRYASLYFIVGVDREENELAVLEFIHNLVETFDRYFESVCELDIMHNIDKAYFILDEMVANGLYAESSKEAVLHPILLADTAK